jgi:hypothetical protein
MTATLHHRPVVELDQRLVVFAAIVALAVCGLLLGLRLGNAASSGTSFQAPAVTALSP